MILTEVNLRHYEPRPELEGLERAHQLGIKKLKLMLSGSDSHSLYNANADTFAALERYRSVADEAHKLDIKMTGSIAVAFGCPYEGELPVERHEAICQKYEELGITSISLADTTGMGNPKNVRKIIRHLTHSFPSFTFSIHLHNTRGMAFANALTALEEGIIDFDSSTGGIGGCPYAPNASGNIATEDLVHGFEEMGIQTGVDLDRVLDAARYLEKQFPTHVDSFLLKAGKAKDLHRRPESKEQSKSPCQTGLCEQQPSVSTGTIL